MTAIASVMAPAPLLAAPDASSAPPAISITNQMGADRASLDSSAAAIVSGSPFGYSAKAGLSAPADYVRFRLKVWRPTGRLIFLRTRTFSHAAAGPLAASFERATADLSLRPGAYPVEMETTIRRNGATKTSILATKLLVYDNSRSVPLALVVRVSGPPLSDSAGRFAADPGRFTRARDDVGALCSWILAAEKARVTLALPPLILEEWQRITAGYEFAGPEGTERVDSAGAVPRAYAATLSLLRSALQTGRLEIVSTGYADPDLSDLRDADLLGDIVPQYDRGLSVSYTSLETTTSTGTAPAGGCVPPAAIPLLRQAGVRYVVVSQTCARTRDATAPASSYRTGKEGLVVLVPDAVISQALSSGDTSATTSLAFGRLLDEEAVGPLILNADLGVGGADAARLTSTLDSLAREPWIRTALARDVAKAPARRTVKLRSADGSAGDPTTYWSEVGEARRWADALMAAVGETGPEAATARRDSLIAECSAWAGADGAWALEDRGRAFSAAAKRLSSDILGKVSLAVEPITLAGTTGKVPVTVRNRSGQTLKLHLKLSWSDGVRVSAAPDRLVELGPKETFVEVPIELSNVLSGDVRVSVTSGNVVLDDASVTVRASYLDRIALVAGVLLLMGGLLVFIIRRVRMAEEQTDTEGHR